MHPGLTIAVSKGRILKQSLPLLAAAGIERDFSFLERQSGMFSFLGLSVEQVRQLRDEYSIYTVDSARVNIASFNSGNIDYFVEALKDVL